VTTLGIEWDLGPEKMSKLIVSGEAIFSDSYATPMFIDRTINENIDIQDIELVQNLLKWGIPKIEKSTGIKSTISTSMQTKDVSITPGYDLYQSIIILIGLSIIGLITRKYLG
jgi:hypothetical protein